ncbi:MAG TPA: mechanosensitive ion channel family protein [Terriglobales bacterium]|jgi:MscS family membrane protein|nr:mechanosensitive ion channel family protein [Terriglobales bacterium]
MFSLLKRALWLSLCLAMIVPAWAYQILPGQQSPNSNTTTPKNGTPADPLGRDTPSGTLYGFLQAAQSGNYSTADQYLQLSPARRQTQGEDIASKLKTVIDRSFTGDLRRISNQPEGTPQEGVPLDKQRVGSLNSGDVDADLVLTRVSDSSGARIWLISSETLAKVPELYEQTAVHQVETHLPQPLVRNEFLGIPLWQWLAILIAIPVAALLGWVAVQILRLPWYFWARYRKHGIAEAWISFVRPLWLVFGVLAHGILVSYIRIPVLQRHRYQQIAGVAAIIGANWLLWRVLRETMRSVRQRAVLAGRMGTGSLMILAERVLKVAIIVLAIFVILGTLGFNLTTPLAGLGIGGIAIAFAAQKTLENLFGGVSILGDEVIRIGDVCRFGDRVGTVEDISLRSTRIRTPDRTELFIPNGSLATMNVENISRRDKILFNPKLGLRYETSPDQMRYVLVQVRRLLYEHPKVETEGARNRLVKFDESALTMEIFSYILTRDYNEFLAVQEDLMLRIMDIVDAAGTGFAFPSQTVYLGRDTGLDKEKAERAAREVQKWRESKQLPFPDFPPSDISEISNSLPYPQPGSALGNGK